MNEPVDRVLNVVGLMRLLVLRVFLIELDSALHE